MHTLSFGQGRSCLLHTGRLLADTEFMGPGASTSAELVIRHLRLSDHLRIFWRHRRVGHPTVNALRVRFDRLIASNCWDVAANVDELNDRYANLYE